MAKLGEIAFLSAGTADSEVYLARAGCVRVSIQGTPTAAGTCRVFFTDLFDGTAYAQGAGAVAGAANTPNIFVIEFPLRGTFGGVFIRYTNTDATAGTIRFSADS